MAHKGPRADEVEAGQRVYTPLMLRAYDLFVLGFSNRFVWRCRSSKMLERYDSRVGARHLDVGSALGGSSTTAAGRSKARRSPCWT